MFELHTSDGRSWLTKAGEPGLWMITLEELAQLKALGQDHFMHNSDIPPMPPECCHPEPDAKTRKAEEHRRRLYLFSGTYEDGEPGAHVLVLARSVSEAKRIAQEIQADGLVILDLSEVPKQPVEGGWVGYDPR